MGASDYGELRQGRSLSLGIGEEINFLFIILSNNSEIVEGGEKWTYSGRQDGVGYHRRLEYRSSGL